MGFDLAQLDSTTRAEEGVEFEIKHPKTGEGLGLYLTIKGADSKAYAAALKKAMKNATPETSATDINAEVAIACTTKWRAVDRTVVVDESGEETIEEQDTPVLIDGVETKFSDEALRRVFGIMKTVRDQAIAFQNGRANFLPNASGS